jgi:hypothetical protein
MLEGGVPLSVVASILGWSAATTARMAKRYGHIGQFAQRQAVAVLDKLPKSKKPLVKIAAPRSERHRTARPN